MIVLYQGFKAWGLPNLSPYCIKVEAYLRMTELAYETRTVDPRKAPKGKIPYIKDGDTVVADSHFIIEYLREKYGDKLDAHLDDRQRALGHVIRRTLEEGSYWVGLYGRWVEDAGFARIKQLFAPKLPPLIGGVVLSRVIRKKIANACYAQGTGRHTRDEIYQLGARDLRAISTLLGDGPFLLGERPTSFDATLFGFLISLLWAPFESPMKTEAAELPNLDAYCRRMQSRYFAEFEPPAITAPD